MANMVRLPWRSSQNWLLFLTNDDLKADAMKEYGMDESLDMQTAYLSHDTLRHKVPNAIRLNLAWTQVWNAVAENMLKYGFLRRKKK